MGKEIYLDPIEFQNVLEKFEKGSVRLVKFQFLV